MLLFSACRRNLTIEFYIFQFMQFKQTSNPRNPHFLLNIWWNQVGHPDVIFHQASTLHDFKVFSPNGYKQLYIGFFRKMETYTGLHSSVYFWTNTARVAESLVPPAFKAVTTNKRVNTYNTIVKNLFPTGVGRVNLGLDLYTMSNVTIISDYIDAVHHHELWFSSISYQLLNKYCAWQFLHQRQLPHSQY